MKNWLDGILETLKLFAVAVGSFYVGWYACHTFGTFKAMTEEIIKKILGG